MAEHVSGNKGHGVHENITIEGEGPAPNAPSGFRFGRMFPGCSYHAPILKLQTCADLGDRMTAQTEPSRKDSKIPAGYTYFGQFVDHDVSMDTTEAEAEDPSTPEVEPTPLGDLIQSRSPSLDLDSLYGGAQARNPEFFTGPKFRIGTTTSSPGGGHSGKALPYDLPRSAPPKPGKSAFPAKIGDPRNDENLAVAQTHLMWLKFHNHIVDALKTGDAGMSDEMAFVAAREMTTKHYQWVVLHDFVKRYIDPKVFDDVIVKGNRKHMNHAAGEVAFMPLEFSVAAYRHGHSQVREEYDWNLNFGPSGALGGANFRQLFEFSELSGNMFGLPTLPSNWIADYRRLYDFGSRTFPHLTGSQTVR